MPTKEELMRVRPPNDVIAELDACVGINGYTKEKIRSAFYKALTLKALDQFENIDERCRNAAKIMIAQLKSKMQSSGPTFVMEFNVLKQTGINTFEKQVEKQDPITKQKVTVPEQRHMARVYGVFEGAPENGENGPSLPPKLGILSLWDDACQVLQDLVEGGTYKMRFSIKNQDDRYELSLNNYQKPEPINIDLPPAREIIRQFFNPISVSQMADNLGPFKLIHCRLIRGFTKLSKGGKNLGFTIVEDVDSSMNVSGERKEQSIMWTSAPEFAEQYGSGTECYIMATINTSQQYGVGAFGDFIIPITAVAIDVPDLFGDEDYLGSSDNNVAPAAPAPVQDSWAPQPAAATPAPENKPPSPAAVSHW
jgi:hypothetical protein